MKTKGFFKYLRELSIVVIGIAITFNLSTWIGNRNEKNDTQQYLDAVKMELEGNLDIVQKQFEFFDKRESHIHHFSPFKIVVEIVLS